MTETTPYIENYLKKEYTLSAAKANIRALFIVLPILLVYILTYSLIWPEQFSLTALKGLLIVYKTWILFLPFILLLIIILGAMLHEMLHGYTWALFCENGLKSIKYGMCWALLTPYCHCQEVLSLRAYMLGGVMPGLLMGLLPAFVGLVFGSIPVFLFGVLFSMAASGDLLVLWMLRHQTRTALVQDHPDLIGCYVFVKG
jgi:hypothetical protein